MPNYTQYATSYSIHILHNEMHGEIAQNEDEETNRDEGDVSPQFMEWTHTRITCVCQLTSHYSMDISYKIMDSQ